MKEPHPLKFDPDPINFRLLHYFRIVAEEMSFTRAAQRLNMSQPPLSKHIKELEALPGVTLFQRTTRSMSLTPAGSRLLSGVANLLEQTRFRCARYSNWGAVKSGIWWWERWEHPSGAR